MHAIVESTDPVAAPLVDYQHQRAGHDLLHSVAVIVDDDRPRLVEVAIHLVDRGYTVTQCHTRTNALRAAIDPTVDAIILDLGRQPTNDVDLIHAVRRYSATPIVVLSERSGPRHRIEALDLGADDYISKPISVDELVARLRAAVRRARAAHSAPVVDIGDAQVHVAAGTVTRRNGQRIRLTPTEWRLLQLLLRQPGRLVSGPALLTAVRGGAGYTDPSYLRSYIAPLRRKLEHEPGRPRHLITEPGMGYRFDP
jgi:two-component system KDP operon response regulator KdpE